MLRALLLLLAMLTAAPAAATMPCHEVAPKAAHAVGAHAMPGEHHQAPDATPPHACLGCIPPANLLATPLAVPPLAPAAPPALRIATLDLGHGPPPLLRPPRLG